MPGQRPYVSKETRAAEKAIASLYLQAAETRRPLTGPVRLTIVAVYRIPTGWPAELRRTAAQGRLHCTTKPDRDNIEKLICDALNGLAWCDDAQIAAGETVKRYGDPERTEVVIESLAGPGCAATPADERRQDWVAAGQPPRPRWAAGAKPSESKTKKLPASLQAAVDHAVAKVADQLRDRARRKRPYEPADD